MNDEFKVELDMEQKLCNSCKKSSTDYYEMVLHLRFKYFDFNNIDINNIKVKEESMNILSQFSQINKLEEVENGFDVYFKDHGQMNKILTLFNKKYRVLVEKRTKKIMGHDKQTSKDLYRHFQSLTLINIDKGDLVEIKGDKYIIKSINKGGHLVLLDFNTGAKKIFSYELTQDYFKLIEKNNK